MNEENVSVSNSRTELLGWLSGFKLPEGAGWTDASVMSAINLALEHGSLDEATADKYRREACGFRGVGTISPIDF